MQMDIQKLILVWRYVNGPRKLRYYLNQLSIKGVTKPAEWDTAVIEFVGIAHKLRLIEEVVICFEYGAGTREVQFW